jgi:hypothetical protein
MQYMDSDEQWISSLDVQVQVQLHVGGRKRFLVVEIVQNISVG